MAISTFKIFGNMSEKDWVLLCLYLTNQADEAQTQAVIQWVNATPEHKIIFQDAQKIFQTHQSTATFDSYKAFKKLDKIIKK